MANTSRRSLVFSPAVTQPVSKRRKTGDLDPEIERSVHEERGMEYNSGGGQSLEDFGVDVTSIHTTVLTRVNQVLAGSGDSSVGTDGDGNSKAFISQVVPALVTGVALAVGEVLKGVLGKITQSSCEKSVKIQEMQRSLLLMKYENDKLAQYTRRETVRIVGIPKENREETEEMLEKKVLEVFKEEGVEVVPGDISVVHRAGKARKHVLVRFVSRKKRREVMMKKKALKEKEKFKNIYLNDDLTPLRAKLLAYMKGSGKFGPVWTLDGRIHCLKKRPPGAAPDPSEKPAVVETPDDLFKVGFDSVDFGKLGLDNFVLGEE